MQLWYCVLVDTDVMTWLSLGRHKIASKLGIGCLHSQALARYMYQRLAAAALHALLICAVSRNQIMPDQQPCEGQDGLLHLLARQQMRSNVPG